MDPTIEYPVELSEARYNRLSLTMPADVSPSVVVGLVGALRGAREDGAFWAAVDRYATSIDLDVAHTDVLAEDSIAYLTLVRPPMATEQED